MAVHSMADGKLLLVSISADDTVNVWSNQPAGSDEVWLGQASWKLQQSISMPLRLQQAVALTALPNAPDW